MKLLIGNPAKARNAVEGSVPAYDRLSVVSTEARDPIVVFAKSLPDGHHFPIHVRSRFRDSTVHGQNHPPFEVFPGFPRRLKPGSDFAQAYNGSSNQFLPVCCEKYSGRASLASNAFAVEVNQKRGVGYHFRPSERLPRSRSIRRRAFRLALCGGGCCS